MTMMGVYLYKQESGKGGREGGKKRREGGGLSILSSLCGEH